MKRTLSTKFKLTLWFTGFLAVLAAVCLGLILVINSHVARTEAFNILSLTVRGNIPNVSADQDRLVLKPEFEFYSNNVYMLIYNKNKALISGQAPPSFPVDAALENGVTKFVPDGESGFYVLDFWIPSGWDDGFWLRGVLNSPDGSQAIHTILAIFSFILPFFILTAAIGGYLIVKKALAPISYITETAESIGEGRDLTRRIGIPKGSDLEVVRLSSAFDHMFERLEQAFEAEKQFTSDASHELRTPTAVILAQCSYAKKHGDTIEDYQEAIEVIDRQAKKMSFPIERLLDLTRLDLGTQKVSREAFDLSAMTAELCVEQDQGGRGISLAADIEPGIVLEGDPFLISRVIVNLLENARKYGKENGHIWARLSAEGGYAVLEVKDDGIGIDPEHIDKIWQRFYQVNPSRKGNSGLGLGLSMVWQIVSLHKGTVKVKSEPGKGSCFTVSLPLHSAS